MILSRTDALRALGTPGPESPDGPFTIAVLYDCVDLLRQGYEPCIERSEWWLRFEELGTANTAETIPMTPEQAAVMGQFS